MRIISIYEYLVGEGFGHSACVLNVKCLKHLL